MCVDNSLCVSFLVTVWKKRCSESLWSPGEVKREKRSILLWVKDVSFMDLSSSSRREIPLVP